VTSIFSDGETRSKFPARLLVVRVEPLRLVYRKIRRRNAREGTSGAFGRSDLVTTLQDHRTESGNPSGALKITEVPELPEKERTKAPENEGQLKEVLEGLQFFTEKSRYR